MDDSATAPHRFRLITELNGTPAGAPEQAHHPQLMKEETDYNECLHLMVVEEPTSFADAEREDCWC
jgi:hypothetical protein